MKLLVSVAALLTALPLAAQQPAPAPPAPPPAPPPLAVGTVAPDFSLPAATAAGVSAKPFNLKDHRGETVILAFFFRARTSG
jgi:peroxiredoxin Q/BCP